MKKFPFSKSDWPYIKHRGDFKFLFNNLFNQSRGFKTIEYILKLGEYFHVVTQR